MGSLVAIIYQDMDLFLTNFLESKMKLSLIGNMVNKTIKNEIVIQIHKHIQCEQA